MVLTGLSAAPLSPTPLSPRRGERGPEPITRWWLSLRLGVLLLAVAGSLVAAPSLAADAAQPRPGEVTLPLASYLQLVNQAEAIAKAREARTKSALPPRAEVVSQRTSLRVDGTEAEVDAELEVLVEGRAEAPVRLPFAGFPATVEVSLDGRRTSGAAVTAGAGGGNVWLVAPEAGRYVVRLRGRAPIAATGGVGRLALPEVAAAIAVDEVDLAADTAWTASGSVIVDETVAGDRRHLRIAGKRGEARALELRRRFATPDADALLARSVLLTLYELRPEGARRHDVVLYEVSRGSLASFTVELPPGLEAVEVATDEGAAVPVVEGSRLTVHRRRQLTGTGYLVLSSHAAAAANLPLAPPRPQVDVRARYLAVASSVAGEARPQPQASWLQVDLEDLPPLLREGLEVVDLAAAWREAAPSAEARLAVDQLPAAPRLPATVRRRDTTTLLTVDGTVLHRDRFVLAATPGASSALDLTLPAGAVLWSARVGEQPVRPLSRHGGLTIPLGFENRAESTVEVVTVLERAIPDGRSRLGLELPQVAVPVLDHRWRVLLPENAQYRIHAGDLRAAMVPRLAKKTRRAMFAHATGATVSARDIEKIPTARDPWATLQETPGVLTDRLNVGGNETGQQSAYGPGGSGSIVGAVVDEQGETLPGVTVTLSARGIAPIVQITNSQGLFRFIALPPGDYTAKVELEGFGTIEYPNLKLNSNRTAVVEVTMNAAVEDVITVTAETPLLDERRLSTGTTVTLDEGGGGGSLDFDGFFEARKRERQQRAATDHAAAMAFFAAGVHELQQGLVGGVKPLNVTVPESGKALLLTGVLPPPRVALELDVKR